MTSRFIGWLLNLRWPMRWAVIGALVAIVAAVTSAVGATGWEYTNSPEFCGEFCHTMPPEYVAYKLSPHARVACVDCHLGNEGVVQTVPRKAMEMKHVGYMLFAAYEPPIYVKNLRPARDTCEKCHSPDKFSTDTFVEIQRFEENVENSQTRTYLIVKTGGGSRREGLGRGIHWHIESEVYYYTDDKHKQTIPYIREVSPDGQVKEYYDVEAGLPPDFGEQVEEELHRMDCIDCHTRISHYFRSPEDAVDDAIARHQIDRTIPEIKKHGVDILDQKYKTIESGLKNIESLDEWYQENYPDFYADNQDSIQQAIGELKEILKVTVFPNLEIGWKTHANNAGHREFPGCFRCHDGKHTSPDGETIRLECNICHSIPEVVREGGAAPVLSIDKPGEPDSHLDSNWLARHRYKFDDTCASCHDVSNPGGTDDSSFCSNSACHATEWKFAGLNAPAIRDLVAPPPVPGSLEPRPVPHPIAPRTDCLICHGEDGVRPYPVENNHPSYEQDLCTRCHQPTLSDTETTHVVPRIPHPLQGRRAQCLVCHSLDGFKPYPINHLGRTTTTCVYCHKEITDPQSLAVLIPHLVENHKDRCLECHSKDAVEPFPDNHEDREIDTCLLCHNTTEKHEAISGATLKTVPPRIPHPLEGHDDCLRCHATDSIKPLPTLGHEGRTAVMCQICHEPDDPSLEDVSDPPTIPHELEGLDDCLVCHAEDSYIPFPSTHQKLTPDTCQLCHQLEEG